MVQNRNTWFATVLWLLLVVWGIVVQGQAHFATPPPGHIYFEIYLKPFTLPPLPSSMLLDCNHDNRTGLSSLISLDKHSVSHFN